MENIDPRFTGAVILSFVIAFALTILPIRADWILWRPEWLALTLIHWGLVSPKKSSFVLAWVLGLMVDALHGSILGQHALGFTIVLFMTLRMRPRILVDSLFQQLFIVFIVLGTYLLINLWILGFTRNSPSSGWGYWLTMVSSFVVWPLYYYYLQFYHAKKKPFG